MFESGFQKEFGLFNGLSKGLSKDYGLLEGFNKSFVRFSKVYRLLVRIISFCFS